jgi:hypothetical protein
LTDPGFSDITCPKADFVISPNKKINRIEFLFFNGFELGILPKKWNAQLTPRVVRGYGDADLINPTEFNGVITILCGVCQDANPRHWSPTKIPRIMPLAVLYWN